MALNVIFVYSCLALLARINKRNNYERTEKNTLDAVSDNTVGSRYAFAGTKSGNLAHATERRVG